MNRAKVCHALDCSRRPTVRMTRPPSTPQLLADYKKASTTLASPARLRIRRSSSSPSSLTAGMAASLLSSVEKALSAMGRCTSPPPLDLMGRLPLTELPPSVVACILGSLGADDMAAAALCCHFLRSCIPDAVQIAAMRIGFELPLLEPEDGPSSRCSITRRLHTLECQAWLAARTMEKLSSGDRKTRELAVLRCSSLPLAAIAHHDLALVKLTTSPYCEVRLRALRTLSQLSSQHVERLLQRKPTAVEAVLLRLEDGDEYVRRASVAVLQAWIDPDSALPPRVAAALRFCCHDPNELVRGAAERLLNEHEEEVTDIEDAEEDEGFQTLPLC